jgi:hypothetical protein
MKSAFTDGPLFVRVGRLYARVRSSGWLGVPAWFDGFEGLNPATSSALLIAAVALWMIGRPYDGIRHDGMFYAGQTMLHLGQENLRTDIFFAHGSQDRYSIFSSINSVLVRLFGWSLASFIAVACMEALWVVAVVLLLTEFTTLPLAALGLTMCALHPYYGPFEIFSIGEPFATARLFAEPFLILAVWATLKRRILLSVLLLVGSAFMHPLLTAPVVLLVAAQAYVDFPARRRAMLVGLGILVVAVIGVAVTRPEVIFASYDDVWWEALVAHIGQVSPQVWDIEGWSVLIFDVGTLVLLGRKLQGRPGRFLEILALIVLGCFLVSCWTAGIFRFVLFTETQLWRAEDMGHIVALGLFPLLIWKKRGDGLLTVLGALFILVAMEFPRGPTSIAAMLGGLVCLAISDRIPPATTSFRWLIGAACVFVIAAGTYNHFDQVAYDIIQARDFGIAYLVHRDVNSVYVALFLFGSLATVAWYSPRAALVYSSALLIVAASVWDHRLPFQLYLENTLNETSALDTAIPPTATVLWSDDLRLPWFILKRPSYLSRNQSAGIAFNRDTAMEFLDHSSVVEAFQSEIATCKEMNGMISTCTLDPEVMRDMCAAGAGGPDFVITTYDVEDLPPDYHWRIPSPSRNLEDFHVFGCASVVKRLSEAAPKSKTKHVTHG